MLFLARFSPPIWFWCLFFNDPATTEIYTLSLHDALPIWPPAVSPPATGSSISRASFSPPSCSARSDRKSTRLNSSHRCISYAVFCLKKKNVKQHHVVLGTIFTAEAHR